MPAKNTKMQKNIPAHFPSTELLIPPRYSAAPPAQITAGSLAIWFEK